MMRTGLRRGAIRVALVTVLTVALLTPAIADELKVGMSTALAGPAQALGQEMKLGVETYFESINATGGVNGNTFRLIALDDGYEPDRCAPNMRQLIGDEGVVAVLGNVGTPTAIVSVPIANEMNTLLYGAFTGAGVLRSNPPDRYVINYRASYAQETAAMIGGLLNAGIKPEEIAFFTQDDGYGDAGYSGAVAALESHGFHDTASLAHGRYTRNTVNVEEGLGAVLDAEVEPRAIIMVGAYKPCAKFIRLAKAELDDAYFLNVSFVGSNALLHELGDQAENVIVTQVVPHFASDLPGVKEYREALAKHAPNAEPGFVSLEGYLAAKVFVEGVAAAGPKANRETIIEGLERLHDYDPGIGVPVSYSQSEHQAMHQVWPTMIRDGAYRSFDWSELASADQ